MAASVSHTPPIVGVHHREPNVTAFYKHRNLGKGTLYIAENIITWISSSANGFSLAYPTIEEHFISRNLTNCPQECLCFMINGTIDLGEEAQLNEVFAALNNLSLTEGVGGSENTEESSVEMIFVPDNNVSLHLMSELISNFQVFNLGAIAVTISSEVAEAGSMVPEVASTVGDVASPNPEVVTPVHEVVHEIDTPAPEVVPEIDTPAPAPEIDTPVPAVVPKIDTPAPEVVPEIDTPAAEVDPPVKAKRARVRNIPLISDRPIRKAALEAQEIIKNLAEQTKRKNITKDVKLKAVKAVKTVKAVKPTKDVPQSSLKKEASATKTVRKVTKTVKVTPKDSEKKINAFIRRLRRELSEKHSGMELSEIIKCFEKEECTMSDHQPLLHEALFLAGRRNEIVFHLGRYYLPQFDPSLINFSRIVADCMDDMTDKIRVDFLQSGRAKAVQQDKLVIEPDMFMEVYNEKDVSFKNYFSTCLDKALNESNP